MTMTQRTRQCAWCEKRVRRPGFRTMKQLEVETVYPPRFWDTKHPDRPVKLSAGADVCAHHATLAEDEATKQALAARVG